MDKTYLLEVATYNVRRWWKRIQAHYPTVGDAPTVKLNNRLKTTAGRAFLEEGYIDLSTELFWEYTDRFTQDTIPHELAHIAAYRLYGDEGHGKGWYSVINTLDINTTRLHNMVNSRWSNRK